MKKRILAVFLAVVLVVGMLPMTTLAEVNSEELKELSGTYIPSDIEHFSYEGTPYLSDAYFTMDFQAYTGLKFTLFNNGDEVGCVEWSWDDLVADGEYYKLTTEGLDEWGDDWSNASVEIKFLDVTEVFDEESGPQMMVSFTVDLLVDGESIYSFGSGEDGDEPGEEESDFKVDDDGVIVCYTGEGGNVEIPESIGDVTITGIGDNAFAYIELTSVTVPEGVTSIGENAFSGCTNLVSVTFAEGSQLETIGNSAFMNCDKLTAITIPEGVTSIGNNAFNSCANLKSLTIPEGVTSIGGDAFASSGLESITIPASVTSIGTGAFGSCQALQTFNFAEDSQLETIGEYAFSSASLTSIVIPASVTSIGAYAFSDSFLESIVIPASVTSIGENAFDGCYYLTTVEFLGTTVEIGDKAFLNVGISPQAEDTCTLTLPEGWTGTTPDKDGNWYGGVFTYDNGTSSTFAITNGTPEGDKVTNHGYITVDETAAADATVTVTVTANKGYQLKTLKYNDGAEDHDILADAQDAYKFTMPAKDVTVTATFKEAEEVPITGTLGVNDLISSNDVVIYYSYDVEGYYLFRVTSANASSVTGTYTWGATSNGINDPNSYYSLAGTTDRYFFAGGEFTVTGTPNAYTLTGSMTGTDGTIYNITLTSPTQNVYIKGTPHIDSFTGGETAIEIKGYDGYTYQFVVNAATLESGRTYTISEMNPSYICRYSASGTAEAAVDATFCKKANGDIEATITTKSGKFVIAECVRVEVNLESLKVDEAINPQTGAGRGWLFTGKVGDTTYNIEVLGNEKFGTFSYSAGTLGSHYYNISSDSTRLSFTDGEVTIVGNADGIISLTGLFFADDGKEYALDWTSVFAITNGTPESAKEMNHGYITVDETAAEGETVTVTVNPATGYQLKTLKYNDGEDHTITVDKDGKYTFTMPAKAVTVTAEFELIHVHAGSKQNGQAATEEAAGWKDYYKCDCGLYFEDEACTTEIGDETALASWKTGKGAIKKLVHTITPVSAQAATQTEAGFKAYYECKNCGKYYEDAEGKNEITDLSAWKAKGGNGYIPSGNEIAAAKTEAKAALVSENAKDALLDETALTNGQSAIDSADTLADIENAKNAAITAIQQAQATELANAKDAAQSALDTEEAKDPLTDKTALTTGKSNIDGATTKAAVEEAKNNALEAIKNAQKSELDAAKASAKTALDTEEAKDPLTDKTALTNGKNNIDGATTKAAVEAAKNAAITAIQQAQATELANAKEAVKPVEVIDGKIKSGETEIEVKDENGNEVDSENLQEVAEAIKEVLDNGKVKKFDKTGIDEATEPSNNDIVDALKAKTEDPVAKDAVNEKDISKYLNVTLVSADVDTTKDVVVTAMVFDVTPMATITVTDKDGEPVTLTTEITNDEISETVTFLLPVDDSIKAATAAVYHKGEFLGNYEIKTDGSGNKYIEVTTDSFSEFGYITLDETTAGAKIGDTLYASLSDAVSKVQDGETITLLKDASGEITVSREVTFTVADNGMTNTATITAGEGYELSETGGTYTVTNVVLSVRFETNGGSMMFPQAVKYGESAKKPKDPTKEGFEFSGWYSDAALTVPYDFASPVFENTTLYAKWKTVHVPDDSEDESEPFFTGTPEKPVSNGAWMQNADGTWTYVTTRKFTDTWGYIYNPYAHDGQHTSDWFWFDRQGNMLTGWQFINGKWYYLNPTKDGTLGACQLGGVTPDGWTVDESGAWIESIPRK